MQKGVSNTELKKSAPDDDFGKDFFDSWKSEKLGNESMDFDMETVPKNKKPSFKFDELDNFELSGNFDKLSSFKLDVPDLDFPGPSKKNEKSHEKSSKEFVPGKKESKENKFSFDFDFNSFDIASKSPEERPSNLSDKKVQDNSSKLATNQVSADRHSDFPRKMEVFLGKRNAIAEDNQKQTNVTLSSHEKYLPTENSDNGQDACLQTSSDGSAEVTLHGIQTDNTTLDVGKLRTKMEMTKSMHLISSSPSRSSSPVSSYNSGYRTKPSGKELSKPDSEIQKHQSRNPLTRITGSLTDPFQVRKQVHDSTCTKRSVEGVKDMDEKQHPCKNLIPPNKQSSPQNLMQPSVKREFTFGGSSKLSGLLNTDFQLNNTSKLGSIHQQSPTLMSKPLGSMLEARTKSTHASTSNDSRISIEPSQNAKMKMAQEIKITETNKDVTPVTNGTSVTAATEMGNLVTGVSSNVEDEENLWKTETLTKDLDKICNVLRKKHEEAKELQVRSIINNSALLLLNHSILEENIQALQKFTTSLLLMEI